MDAPLPIEVNPETGHLQPIIYPGEEEPPVLDPFYLPSDPIARRDEFIGCRDTVKGVAIDLIGKRLLAASWDEAVTIWPLSDCYATGPSVPHNLVIGTLVHADWVNAVALYANVASEEAAAAFTSGAGVIAGVSPQDIFAVTACEDGAVTAWSLETQCVKFQLYPAGRGNSMTSLSVQSHWVLVTSLFSVFLLSVQTHTVLRHFSTRVDANCAVISRDGGMLFVGQQDGRIGCWDVAGVFLVRELNEEVASANQKSSAAAMEALKAARNAGGSSAAGGSPSPASSSSPPQKKGPVVTSGSGGGGSSVAKKGSPILAILLDPVHVTGGFLFASTDSGAIQVWSTSTGELLHRFSTHRMKPVVALTALVRLRPAVGKRVVPGGGGGGGAPNNSSGMRKTITTQLSGGDKGQSTAASTPFHDALQVTLVSCGTDGTIQYHDLDTKVSRVAHCALGLCLTSYWVPQPGGSYAAKDGQELQGATQCLVIGDHQGRVRRFIANSALVLLDDDSAAASLSVA